MRHRIIISAFCLISSIIGYGQTDSLRIRTKQSVENARQLRKLYKNDESIEGHAQFILKFKDGFSAVVTFSGYSNCGYDARYYFTNGALKVEGTFQLFEFKDGDWQRIETAATTTDAMKIQIEEFIKYINDEPCNIADGEYGKAVIKVIEKIYG